METATLDIALEMVRLTPADIDTIHTLHCETIAALPDPGAVRPDEPDFFADIFACGGEIMGLVDAEGMVAYGVLRPELAREKDRFALDDRVAPQSRLWVLDGSAVRPSHWRRGLQRHIVGLRIARAGALGAADVIAKASPGNLPSMRNLLKCGFEIVGRIRKPYGWRYIHHRPVAGTPGEGGEGGTWVKAADIDEAQRRFDAGEVARACAPDAAGEAALRFVPRGS